MAMPSECVIDGSKVRFWATKKLAAEGARAIGWPVSSLMPVRTRFCGGWAIHQYGDGFLSRERYAELYHDRRSVSLGANRIGMV